MMSTYMAADSATSDSVFGGYECSQCGKVFRRDAALRRHRQVSHTDAADDTTTRRYRCQTCRRPFTSRPALNSHLSVVHGATTNRDCHGLTSSVRQLDNDGELLLVEDCCVDDEICIAADGGSMTFQPTEQSDSVGSRHNSMPATTPSNNNNSEIKNKNVIMQPTVAVTAVTTGRVAVRSSVGPTSTVLHASDATVAASATQLDVSAFETSRKSNSTGTTVTGSAVVSIGRLVPVCRSTVETPHPAVNTRVTAPQRTPVNHCALHKTPKSPLEAETFHGDAYKPGDTAQKIIVYVKTEPSHQQQVAYCAAESTSGGAGRSGSGAPCQFVCPVCGRDFASEKYLSMHVSSIHRTNNDIASIIALETAASPSSGAAGQTSILTGEATAVDTVAVALTATPSGTLATAAQPSSTSVGGSKSHWTCNICRKAFAQNSSYKNHIRTHSDDRPYVCSICSIGFKERYHLKKHELFKHTTALNETCRICGKRFKDSTAVRAHERIHSDVRPYGCTLCGKTFKTSECLWHHENRSKTCGKMGSRNKHVGVVTLPHGQRQRRATISHVISTATLTSPRLTCHSTSPQAETEDTKPELSDLQPQSNDSDCTPAPVVESSSQEVTEARDVVIKTEPADCELFDASLNTMLESTDTSFVDFWQTFDELDVVTPGAMDSGFPSSPDHVCSSPDTTDADSTRSADEASTTPGGTYNSISSSLFDGVKRHDCARCDKRFASAATLAKHLQVHAEVRPYRCIVCDIGFKLKVHLKKHNLYRHSEEYPCECSICGKRFKDSSAVRLHERIHSTARPFQCLHCGKSFKTRENLWGHRNRGPCEQRSVTSLLLTSPTTSYPLSTSNMAAPQFVANNVRLFHSAEFGPILGVPVNAKLVFKEGDKLSRADERLDASATITAQPPVSVLTTSNTNKLRRVSAVRVGDTTRLAVSKMTSSSVSTAGGLSLVSVPTAVVTPIKREMISDRKLSTLVTPSTGSVLTGNFVLPVPPSAGDRKRSAVDLATADVISPHKYLAVASDDDKFASIQRLLSPTHSPASTDTLLSPNMEQNLADALSALAGQADAMVIEGDCLPSINDATDEQWPGSTDYDDELDVPSDDWSEIVAASCDQLLSSPDNQNDALSDAGSLSDYRRLMTSPSLAVQSDTGTSPTAAADDDSDTNEDDACTAELASDTMWCNWAPENDLGSLLIFGP